MVLTIVNELQEKIYLVSMGASLRIIHENKDKLFQDDMFPHIHFLDYKERIFTKCGCDERIPPLMYITIGESKLIYRAFDEYMDCDLKAVIVDAKRYEINKTALHNKYNFILLPECIGTAKIPIEIFNPDKGVTSYPLCILEIIRE